MAVGWAYCLVLVLIVGDVYCTSLGIKNRGQATVLLERYFGGPLSCCGLPGLPAWEKLLGDADGWLAGWLVAGGLLRVLSSSHCADTVTWAKEYLKRRDGYHWAGRPAGTVSSSTAQLEHSVQELQVLASVCTGRAQFPTYRATGLIDDARANVSK